MMVSYVMIVKMMYYQVYNKKLIRKEKIGQNKKWLASNSRLIIESKIKILKKKLKKVQQKFDIKNIKEKHFNNLLILLVRRLRKMKLFLMLDLLKLLK